MTLSKRKEKLIGRLRRRRTRPREGLVLVEGLNTVEEALDAGVELRFAVAAPSLREFGRGRRLVERLEGGDAPLEWVDEDTFGRLSDTDSPRGLLLVIREPCVDLRSVLDAGAGRILLLDGVQDPGNLGTLVRAARAFALDGVAALDGTVDPWNPKSVRGAAGTSFRIPVVKASWSEVEPALADRGIELLAAEAGGRDVADVEVTPPWALAVGNEGAGPRRELLEAAEMRISVPMPGGAESLNAGVAGSILLYVLARRRSKPHWSGDS